MMIETLESRTLFSGYWSAPATPAVTVLPPGIRGGVATLYVAHLVATQPATGPSTRPTTKPVTVAISTRFFWALAEQETRRNPNAPPGDNGTAVGIIQLRPGAVEDVNRVYHKSYTLADRSSPARSFEIMDQYLNYWGNHMREVTGRAPTVKDLARIYNGGPTGYTKASTEAYGDRVVGYMNTLYPNEPPVARD